MKPRGRPSLKQTIRTGAINCAFLAAASPRELSADALAMATIPTVTSHVNPLKNRKAKTAGIPYESQVQAEIITYLQTRPDVGCIIRFNSGTMREGSRLIRMNTIYLKAWCEQLQENIYARLPDLQAMHKPSGRLIAIEVKRVGWKRPSDVREHQQALYLDHVRRCGGIAGFCKSVADVIKLLGEVEA